MANKYLNRTLILLFGLATLALSGCAARHEPIYHWGDFQNQQYAYFKGDRGPEDSIQNLEKILEDAKSRGKPVPPGFQAHLGMLYGVTGRTDMFERNLLAEKQQYPESTAFLDFLLKKKQNQKGNQ